VVDFSSRSQLNPNVLSPFHMSSDSLNGSTWSFRLDLFRPPELVFLTLRESLYSLLNLAILSHREAAHALDIGSEIFPRVFFSPGPCPFSGICSQNSPYSATSYFSPAFSHFPPNLSNLPTQFNMAQLSQAWTVSFSLPDAPTLVVSSPMGSAGGIFPPFLFSNPVSEICEILPLLI